MTIIDGWGLADIELEGYAQLAKKVVIVSITTYARKIRVVFDRGMLNNNALVNISNYQISPLVPTSVQPVINSITTENSDVPRWVELNCSEHTDGDTYQLAISLINGPTDPELMPVDPATTPKSYIGEGENPTIDSVAPISANLITVKFNESMLDEPAIRDKTNYSFDKGLITVDVLSVDGDTATIITSNQTSNELYTLTVTQPASNKIQDLAYNQLATGSTAQFLGYEVVVESELLDLEMYRFLTNSIRSEDLQNGLFLKRFLQGFQEVWKTTHNSIFTLKNLWDVLNIPNELLQYMKNIVGWTDDLSKITDQLSHDTLRKLISVSIAFWKNRGTESTTINILELLTQSTCRIWNWFDFRWLVGEAHLGEEHQGRDPHIINIPSASDSEYHSNLRIVDDGYLNHDLVESIVKLTRAIGERITINYLLFLDVFNYESGYWNNITGANYVVEDGLAKFNSNLPQCYLANMDGSDLWDNYQLYCRIRNTGTADACGAMIYAQNQGSGFSQINGYFVMLSISTNRVILYKVVAGSLTFLAAQSFTTWGTLEFDTWYGLRTLAINDDLGNVNFSIYVDNDLILTASDNTWTQGTIGFLHYTNVPFECDEIEAFRIPADTTYIDINS